MWECPCVPEEKAQQSQFYSDWPGQASPHVSAHGRGPHGQHHCPAPNPLCFLSPRSPDTTWEIRASREGVKNAYSPSLWNWPALHCPSVQQASCPVGRWPGWPQLGAPLTPGASPSQVGGRGTEGQKPKSQRDWPTGLCTALASCQCLQTSLHSHEGSMWQHVDIPCLEFVAPLTSSPGVQSWLEQLFRGISHPVSFPSQEVLASGHHIPLLPSTLQ